MSEPMPPGLLDALNFGVLVYAPATGFAYLNARAEEMLSVSARAASGRFPAEFLAPGSDMALIERFRLPPAAAGGTMTERYTLVNRAGENLRVEAGFTRLDAEQVLVTLLDRTGSARFEREEALRDQVNRLSVIARGLAHEIRNPLAGLRGALDLVRRGVAAGGADLDETLSVAVREVERIDRLIARLSMLAQPNVAGELSPVNLLDVLDSVIKLVTAEFSELTVEREYDFSLPPVPGHRDDLTAAFLNLVRNAAEAVRGRGIIRVATGRPERLVPAFRARRTHAGLVAVQIHDNGPGVAAEVVDRLFEAFVTNKPGGHGLGLALCRRVALAHGGTIEYDRSPLGGACFTVYLARS